jgi:hypothetical protein
MVSRSVRSLIAASLTAGLIVVLTAAASAMHHPDHNGAGPQLQLPAVQLSDQGVSHIEVSTGDSYLEITLEDVIVGSYQTGGSSEDQRPAEEVAMAPFQVLSGEFPMQAASDFDPDPCGLAWVAE